MGDKIKFADLIFPLMLVSFVPRVMAADWKHVPDLLSSQFEMRGKFALSLKCVLR